LRDRRSEGRVSELRRRFDAASDAQRKGACEVSGVNEARAEREGLRSLNKEKAELLGLISSPASSRLADALGATSAAFPGRG